MVSFGMKASRKENFLSTMQKGADQKWPTNFEVPQAAALRLEINIFYEGEGVKNSPSKSSLSSRLASFLSRRICLSISSFIRFCSFASSVKQHSTTMSEKTLQNGCKFRRLYINNSLFEYLKLKPVLCVFKRAFSTENR